MTAYTFKVSGIKAGVTWVETGDTWEEVTLPDILKEVGFCLKEDVLRLAQGNMFMPEMIRYCEDNKIKCEVIV